MEKYVVKKQWYWQPDIGYYESYGIVCTTDPQVSVEDLSCDHELVSQLARSINEEDLDEGQLLDAAYDAIC
ncbi:MAG: hypothetical protein Q4G07_05890 [Oscillospiraceae bacterium]|nr:hypothetical protein [Oscillospiraceae bacterium]